MKPLIGIAPLFDDERNSIWMLPDYMNAIRHAGGVPVILPLEGTSEDICAAASVCSGFVLTGGQDVDPKIYGETPLPQCGTPNEIRDQTDYLILCHAMKYNLPLLGICRGIQLINAGLGGTLWQDLPSQTGTKIMHSQPPPRDIPVHDVRIIPGTPLHELLETEKLAVNSFHHQGVKDAAPGVTVMAVAEDGLVEAIAVDGKDFIWGVQWHPEHMFLKDGREMALFRELVRRSAAAK